MEFRLVYEGSLHANGDNREKHAIRKHFHRQLSELWKQQPQLKANRELPLREIIPQLQPPKFDPDKPWIEHLANEYKRNGFRFAPIVREENAFTCGIDILFLRRDNMGSIITHGGDIDNRLKSLFDAFRMPMNATELAGATPDKDEDPFFCLLEDDKLITSVSVTTDRFLTPMASLDQEHHVHIVAHITVADPQALFMRRYVI
jgi:hypothetical protein